MTPEEKAQLNQLVDLFYRQHQIDKDVFNNPVILNGEVYFKLPNFLKDAIYPTGTTTGLKLGITGDKLAFLGATPVPQQSAIVPPTGGATIDTQARTAINSIIDVLQKFGQTA